MAPPHSVPLPSCHPSSTISAQPAPSWVALASHMDPPSFGFFYIFPDSVLHVEKLKGRVDLNRSRERQVLGLKGCDGGWFWRHMGKVRSPLRASQVVGWPQPLPCSSHWSLSCVCPPRGCLPIYKPVHRDVHKGQSTHASAACFSPHFRVYLGKCFRTCLFFLVAA